MRPRNRRIFMLHAIAGSAAYVVHGTAGAQTASAAKDAASVPGGAPGPQLAVPVKETDAYPKSMGFRLKTTDVDKAKFPRHEVSQKCSECQLYTAKQGEEMGACSFFKRQVPPEGWCRNFKQRKAA